MKITLDITHVQIISPRSGQDEICLDLGEKIHGEFEDYNTSTVYVRTAQGNGVAALAALGYTGSYTLTVV